MLIIRRTEEQLAKLYAAGKIFGGCHTYIGEEAVATGVCAHLRPTTRCSARIAATATRWPRAFHPPS